MSASSLEVVLSWLMEYALKYDMEKLRKELIRLFPKHCSQKVIEKLSIPDELHLTTLCHLRGFRNGQTVLIDNLDDLINLIEYFQKVKMAIDSRPFKSSRLLSKVEPDYLVAFLDQLELLRDLLDLKSRMEFLSHDYKKDFFDDGENEYDRYIHNGLITFQGEVISKKLAQSGHLKSESSNHKSPKFKTIIAKMRKHDLTSFIETYL